MSRVFHYSVGLHISTLKFCCCLARTMGRDGGHLREFVEQGPKLPLLVSSANSQAAHTALPVTPISTAHQ